MQEIRVAIIEDDLNFRSFLIEALNSDFLVSAYNSGQEAIDGYRGSRPDVVILDVGLPDITGYDVCREIKKIDADDQTSIIFLSGRNTLGERLEGYHCGGDDYLVKPVSVKELLAKVKAVSRFQQRKIRLRDKEHQVRDMAFQALSEASRYGVLLRFIKKVYGAEDREGIMRHLLELVHEFSVSGCVQVRGPWISSLRSSGQECSPIELELFRLLQNRGRIYEFNKRCLFNGRYVSILVARMPPGGDDNQAFKDLLSTVMEVADVRIGDISRRDRISGAVQEFRSAIASFLKNQDARRESRDKIVEDMFQELEAKLHDIGINEEAEQSLIELAKTRVEDISSLYNTGAEIENRFTGLVDRLEESVEK